VLCSSQLPSAGRVEAAEPLAAGWVDAQGFSWKVALNPRQPERELPGVSSFLGGPDCCAMT